MQLSTKQLLIIAIAAVLSYTTVDRLISLSSFGKNTFLPFLLLVLTGTFIYTLILTNVV